MSSGVNTFLVQDDNLLVTDQVRYAVLKGAANNTVVPYNAISGTNSSLATVAELTGNFPASLTWNVQVPSQEIIVKRNALVRHRVRVAYNKVGNASAVAEPVWNSANNNVVSGVNNLGADCLNAFPVSQCIQTIQCTINNSTVSMNVQDTINSLLRFYDSRDLAEYSGLCPYLVDRQGIYSSAVNGATSFSNGQSNLLDEAFVPRSSYPVDVSQGGAASFAIAAGANNVSNVIEFTVYEPLWVSPWTWAHPKVGGQGMYGLQNIAVVMNMGNYQRMIRALPQYVTATGVPATSTSILGLTFVSSELILNYLTPQPSTVMIPRNVVPYYEVPRYYLTSGTGLAASVVAANTRFLSKVQSGRITSNNLQLNQIPDKLIIFFEPVTETLTTAGTITLPYYNRTNCPDFYAVLETMSLNFNNQAGLLSTWTQKDFFHAARDAGSKQSWYEFTGELQTATPCAIGGQFQGGTYSAAIGDPDVADAQSGGLNLPMTGSIIVLQFGKDIELPDYYASGSIGNFNLQINAEISHYQPFAVSYRMVCITVNSGVFVNEKGTSNPYTALLRKEDVLNASAMEPMGCHEFTRMVGGGFLDTLKSIGSSVWNVAKPLLRALAPMAQSHLAASSNPYAQAAAKGIGIAAPLLGQGMGAGAGAGDRLARHAKGSGYAY